ncbi:MAG: type I-E CRISPR-associated protein Cas7/Cse4/CasC [Thermoanaerobaculia bacterium]|nr:type I-E CRISPR-associated protein Cas7/Cse4/CasC [Thermoanaerobaculia bacterium]
MTRSRFLQIHTLTSYPASLLNRDDAGFAKRIPFGGASRIRISSQCLKRHWRTFDGENSIVAIPAELADGRTDLGSIRSRFTFEKFVLEPLVREKGVDSSIAREVTETLMKEVLGESAKAKQTKDAAEGKKQKGKAKAAPAEKDEPLQTPQLTVLGRPELRYILEEASEMARLRLEGKSLEEVEKSRMSKAWKENIKQLRTGAGLDAAMFGRMVTSDVLARGDAAIHVAHAFTVHAEESESDYFSAVDDLQREAGDSHLGSAHINATELSSGLFYGYVVIDIPLLISNIEGCDRVSWQGADATLASEVVRRFIHLVATVSPGAKLGSTAPYAYAHLVLAEAGTAQPRSLANAFLRPVKSHPDVLGDAFASLASHTAELDRMYGRPSGRYLAAIGPRDRATALEAGTSESLADLATWAASVVRGEA